MELQKISNLLGTTLDHRDLPRFVTKKWIGLYDQSGKNYNVNKEIRIKAPMLRSDLCDYSDAYIVAKGTITAEKDGGRNNDGYNKPFVFKNNAPFINCISKINGVVIGIAEELWCLCNIWLNIAKITKKATGSSWNYHRDGPDNDGIRNSGSFKYKTSIIGNTPNNNNNTITYAETVVPLKDLSIFWRSLSIPLINC